MEKYKQDVCTSSHPVASQSPTTPRVSPCHKVLNQEKEYNYHKHENRMVELRVYLEIITNMETWWLNFTNITILQCYKYYKHGNRTVQSRVMLETANKIFSAVDGKVSLSLQCQISISNFEYFKVILMNKIFADNYFEQVLKDIQQILNKYWEKYLQAIPTTRWTAIARQEMSFLSFLKSAPTPTFASPR